MCAVPAGDFVAAPPISLAAVCELGNRQGADDLVAALDDARRVVRIDPAEGLTAGRRALAMATAAGDIAGVAAALHVIGRALRYLDDIDAAVPMLTEALDLFVSLGHESGQAQTLVDLGSVCAYRGQAAEARAHWERASSLARSHGDVLVHAEALNNLGVHHADAGRIDAARRFYLDAIKEARRSADPGVSLAWPLANLAGLIVDARNHRPSIPLPAESIAAAEALAREAVAIAAPGSYPNVMAQLELLALRCMAGYPAETLDGYTELVVQSQLMGVHGYHARALAGRAAALAALGRLSEATEDIRAAVRLGHPDPIVRAEHLRLAADILGMAEHAQESLALLQEHLVVLGSIDAGTDLLSSELLSAQLTVSRAVRAVEAQVLRAAELEQLAYDDALTGLHNRRAFDDGLAVLLLEPMEQRGLVLVVMVDVDCFKAVNDRCLHVGGDAVLRDVAAILDRTRRPEDLLARYGGDEFALALAGVDPRDAVSLLERFRQAVAAQPWPELDADLSVTVSVGGAIAHPGEAAAEVIHRADRAMYAAKAAGRDAVSVDLT